MTFPYSPFDLKFDVTSINEIYKRQGDFYQHVDNTEKPDITKLLRWLCTTPKTTSYRVNPKYDIEDVRDWLLTCLRQNSSEYDDVPVDSMITKHTILKDVLLLKSFHPRERSQDNLKEVIVDPDCGAAILRGSHIFGPGVIGMESGTKRGDIVNVFADIVRKCKKGLKTTYEDEKIFVGTGEVLMNRPELFGENLKPRGVAVRMLSTTSGVPSLDTSGLPSDAVLLQNIPSIVCAVVLNPLPGESVLDMCASPGNKTTHLGILMKNQGVLVAVDKTRKKLNVLKQNCEKYSLSSVRCYEFDSTRLYDPDGTSTDHPPYPMGVFDKILLDAPCSNLGRRPQLYNNITNKEAWSYVPLQRKLFRNAVNLLKIGGCLVYSTCTITLAENEGIVSWALKTFDCLELSPTVRLGGPGWNGTTLTEEQRNLVQRFGPETDTVGFFIAHFVKR